jgi:N-methylhydantoinase A/oxoprolinase/acetone carboxylase beta subunit
MFADVHDLEDVFSFHMGGTTAKGAAIVDGDVPTSYETDIAREYRFKEGSGYDLITPMLDLTEIGAGGGSIAAINDLGLVDVGPESSGAEPGPVCYDQGGIRPTVTDAAFLLGYLGADNFFGGRIELNEAKTRQAFEEHLSEDLDISVTEAAWQVFEVVNENMASAFRKYTSSRGIDPRSLDLVTIGGAGPMVAFEMAKKLGIDTIVCPYGSGVGSSIGLVKAPRLYEASVTHQVVLATMVDEDFVETFENLYDEAREALVAAGADESNLEIEPSIDMRHVQQGYEIEVPLPVNDFDDIDAELAKEQFRSVYQQKYNRDILEFPIEVMNFHLTLREASDAGETVVGKRETSEASRESSTRKVYFDEYGHVPADVYRWDALEPGSEHEGPVIVEADQTTAVADPDSTIRIGDNMDLVITLEGDQ